MKLGLKLWSVNTDAYLREAARLYAREVFDYLEIYFVPGSGATAAEWRSTGIPCIVHAPHSRHGVNLAAADHESYNREMFAAVRKFADALSAPDIIAHGGSLGSVAEIVRQLKLIGDPRILIENKPCLPIDRSNVRLAGSMPEEVAEIIAGADCGFCLDIGHMVASANARKADWRGDFTAFLALKPKMFHLSDLEADSDIDQHLHFGDGSLPIREIVSRLPSDARLSIETKRDSSDNLDDFVRDAAFLCALAREPVATFTDDYRTRHFLPNSSTVGTAVRRLVADSRIDMVDGCCRLLDPVFAHHLRTLC